ncbi:YihY/virulence factor BrkB family protein [Catenuloplanes indicus]|uniref:Membrane protein n=1 Tax=Catenuloplanes indicus TaxID=137267 RepID=A0AAE3W326_9ACTN|nr:YhjD/YihY/BrkB family envelope integrity protein [Catenuloplanes indicus]MDQ0368420.1 membrane protein [Catenuloplanes indicus]
MLGRVLGRALAAVDDAVVRVRRRHRVFDHFWLAQERYGEVLAGRCAAAIAYYSFFALFAIGLLAYSVFGFLLSFNLDLFDAVRHYLSQNMQIIDPNAILDSRGRVGLIGLVGLLFSGIGWVEAIRSSQRLIWRLDQQPGNLIIRRLVDLGVLLGILIMLAASIAAVDALEGLIGWLAGGLSFLTSAYAWLMQLMLNMLLGAALLVAVPRLRMTLRRVAPPVLQVGIGVTLLNTAGRYVIGLAQHNPAYTVVTGAVGLLVYLYLLNQMLLFAAAWAATSPHGKVWDYSGGPVENHDGDRLHLA